MTKDEFDALPDASLQYGRVERIVDGKRVWIPIQRGDAKAIYQDENDGSVFDAQGVEWMTGWLDGVRVKQRIL